MAAHKFLKNAPVKEALIDIQFQPPIALERIEQFVASVELSNFPKRSALWQASVNIAGADDAPPVASSTHAKVGIRLDSADGRFVVQIRTNGLTVSRLSPYKQWTDLKEETKKWWEGFAALAHPEEINRLAVRYINTIVVPLPIKDFSEYLVSAPSVPSQLSQGLASFLYRVEIPDNANQTMSVITQALEAPDFKPDGTAKLPIVLDIDVSRSMLTDQTSFRSIEEILEYLRGQKNEIFFAYITDKTVELFE